jgi:hypothetical protein
MVYTSGKRPPHGGPKRQERTSRTLILSRASSSKQPRQESSVEPVAITLLVLFLLNRLPVRLVTIKDVFASEQVNLMCLDTLGLHDKLVSKEKDKVDGNAQVSSDEVLVVEFALVVGVGKDGKVLGQGDDAAPEE